MYSLVAEDAIVGGEWVCESHDDFADCNDAAMLANRQLMDAFVSMNDDGYSVMQVLHPTQASYLVMPDGTMLELGRDSMEPIQYAFATFMLGFAQEELGARNVSEYSAIVEPAQICCGVFVNRQIPNSFRVVRTGEHLIPHLFFLCLYEVHSANFEVGWQCQQRFNIMTRFRESHWSLGCNRTSDF